jgi:MFS family permease
VLLLVYVTGSVTGAIPGLMMPYFTKYVLQPENADKWLGVFLAIYFGSGFLSLPIWILLARKFGKKAAWLMSFVPGTTGSLSLFFFVGQGDLLLTACILMWSGSAFSAGMFLGPSVQADVIDYDELYTGKRREAQYNGLWSVMTKFTVIPSMAVPLAVLAAYGYTPNVQQTPVVQDVIRIIFGVAPAITSIIAFVLATRFPITQHIHEQIWDGIRAHQRGEDAVDPLTGATLRPPIDRGVPEETGWFLDHFSPRELQRSLVGGPSTLVRSAVLMAAVALTITIAATWLTIREASNLAAEPGVVAVFAVVVGGFSFTAFCFHLFRVRAAFKMSGAPVPRGQIERHIEFTNFVRQGGFSPDGAIPLVSEPAEG